MSAISIESTIRPASGLRNWMSIARRNLLHIKGNPEQLVEMTIQPIMFLTLFVFVFGSAIGGSWQDYLQFALPGILVQGVAFLPFATALGLNMDFQRGVIDRFRSLPMTRSAVIGGRVMADSVRIIWSITIITLFGMILGFRFGTDPASVLGGVLIILAFGLTMCWPMAFIGIVSKTPESVNTL